ncbi:MAG: hypothetical protein QXJ45_06130 [Thermoproteota archaeon]
MSLVSKAETSAFIVHQSLPIQSVRLSMTHLTVALTWWVELTISGPR